MKSLCEIGVALERNWLEEELADGSVFQISKEWPAFSAHLAFCATCNARLTKR